jgi:hypothetical protein
MKRIVALLVVVAVGSPALLAGAALAFSDRQLQTAFYQTVFGAEYSHWGAQADIVKKFAGPVRVYIDNSSRHDRRGDVAQFVRSLPRLIRGLDMALVGSPDQANFRISVVDRAQYRTVVRNLYGSKYMHVPGRCLVRVYSRPSGIRRSDAVIVADEGEFLFQRCLVEEVLQGLGPVNDSDGLPDSVFNDSSRQSRFTAHDRYILNILYHPRIRPGMNAREAEAVLPSVIRDVRRRLR